MTGWMDEGESGADIYSFWLVSCSYRWVDGMDIEMRDLGRLMDCIDRNKGKERKVVLVFQRVCICM